MGEGGEHGADGRTASRSNWQRNYTTTNDADVRLLSRRGDRTEQRSAERLDSRCLGQINNVSATHLERADMCEE